MDKLHLVAVLPALAFGLALPAWAADSLNKDMQSSTATGQADQVSQESATAEGQASQADQKKHPPTAVMDRATPAQKSPSEIGPSAKHPPTGVMDSATPDEKSPGTSS